MRDAKTILEAAQAYARLNWHILPAWWIVGEKCACGNPKCKSPGKHPIGSMAPQGQNSASTDEAQISAWWARFPDANIAAYLEPSGMCAIDIDPRNGGIETIDNLEAKYGKLESDVLQYTGGGGEHRVFQAPANGGGLPGKLGPGVDVKLNGYIMLEPSNHVSGKEYAWEMSSDPRDGIVPSPLPDWLRDLSGQRYAAASVDAGAGDRFLHVTQDQLVELEQAVMAIRGFDERETWLTVGMGLHSTGHHQWAFDLWSRWSEQSSKFEAQDQIRTWRSFKGRGLDGMTYRTLFEFAKRDGVTVRPIAAPVEELPEPIDFAALTSGGGDHAGDDVDEPQRFEIREAHSVEVDPELLRPPGVLGEIAEWINQNSRKPQPQFAVTAALSAVATACGRRFCSNNDNWPSLFFVNIAGSSTGKEHAKQCAEELLDAWGLSNLIGPAGYTSGAGVLSALMDQPNHLTVIDEYHREIEQATQRQNGRAHTAQTSVMEAYGRNSGVIRGQGYSTAGMSARDKEGLAKRSVYNPSINLMCMAVPEMWEIIGSKAARDGFLNRFIVIESHLPRQVSRIVERQPVPERIKEWATIRNRYTGLIDPDTNATQYVTPVMLPFTTEARRRFTEVEEEIVRQQNAHEKDGMAAMWGRVLENAMRVSLVCALARSDDKITGEDARWSIKFVLHYAKQTIARLMASVADSEFEADKKQVLECLIHASGHGMTEREIDRASRRFRGMTQRQQTELLNSLAALDQIKRVTFEREGRGRKRTAWVAVSEVLDHM